MSTKFSFIRDPFIQFMLIGAVVFAVFTQVTDEAENNKKLVVTQSDVSRLVSQWTEQYATAPTPEQKQAIIDHFVQEEIIYREAKAIDLGKDDIIIRRRLVQKFRFLSESFTDLPAPTDEELSQFYAENMQAYKTPQKTSFKHVFIKQPVDGTADIDGRIATIRERLNQNQADSNQWRNEGDAFMLQRQYAARTNQQIAEEFGRHFPKELNKLELDTWTGPILSIYGWHIVKVVSRTDEAYAPLDTIKDQVKSDYMAVQRTKNNDAFYKNLTASYQVIYE